jgi:putative endonuclease
VTGLFYAKAYFVYVLKSLKDGRYYVGTAKDLPERLQRHNQGRSEYTRNARPWELVYSEEHPSRSEAMKREYGIKRQKRKEYIESLIKKHCA